MKCIARPAKVASVIVSSPVAYIDFDIPESDAAFLLIFSNVNFSEGEQLCAAFSADGGVTFNNDLDNYDTYLTVNQFIIGNGTGETSQQGNQSRDSLAYFHQAALANNNTPLPLMGEAVITPGSSTSYPSVSTVSSYIEPSTHSIIRGTSCATFYHGATVPPSLARQNVIRVLPYGDGKAVNVSGHTITSGSFSLLRLPA